MQKDNSLIEKAADTLRQRLNVSDVSCPDLVYLLENQVNKLIPNFTLKRVFDEELPEDVEADANTESGELRISERIWQQLKNGCVRARFTVAHELGHFFLNHKGTLRRDKQKRRQDPATIVQENEANIFAGYFLSPTKLAQECNGAQELSEKFQISNSAAEIRLETLSADIRRKKGIKRPLPAGVIDFMNEQEKRGLHYFRHLPEDDREK